MVISSIENSKMKLVRKLNTKKYRKNEKMFLVEGAHLVYEAYNEGYLLELIKVENEPFSLDISTTEITKDIMSKISLLDTPTTVMGLCKMREERKELGDKILILDGVQDPGNVGTIIRSAVAFNINTLIVSDDSVDIYNSKTIRASQGMLFHINILEENLLDFIPRLKKSDYTIYGTDVLNGTELKDITVSKKYAVIMGNEGNGVNPFVKRLCDKDIYIKMSSNCESLNVGVATSIILYELNKY